MSLVHLLVHQVLWQMHSKLIRPQWTFFCVLLHSLLSEYCFQCRYVYNVKVTNHEVIDQQFDSFPTEGTKVLNWPKKIEILTSCEVHIPCTVSAASRMSLCMTKTPNLQKSFKSYGTPFALTLPSTLEDLCLPNLCDKQANIVVFPAPEGPKIAVIYPLRA